MVQFAEQPSPFTRCRHRDAGLIVIEEDDTIMMLPALTVDQDTVAKALAILEDAS